MPASYARNVALTPELDGFVEATMKSPVGTTMTGIASNALARIAGLHTINNNATSALAINALNRRIRSTDDVKSDVAKSE